MTHDLALTLNRATTQRKKTIAATVEGLVGLRDDQLTTDEGRLCLEILRRGPQNPQEKVIHGELEELANGTVRVPALKLLIHAAAQSIRTDATAQGPQPVATPPRVPMAIPSEKVPRVPQAPVSPTAAAKRPLRPSPKQVCPPECQRLVYQ